MAASHRLHRVLLSALAVTLVASGGWLLLPRDSEPALGPAGAKPRVTMMTSLPIGLNASASVASALDGSAPADLLIDALGARVDLRPVDALDAATLAQTDALLLAHPRALPPETLVAIDGWVRGGGTIVLLADGLSSWHMVHPLGDPRNPPVTSLLTPLLTRWGLRLDAPAGMESALVVHTIGSHTVRFLSPGRLIREQPGCTVDRSALVAQCRIGAGKAVVIADADFLQPELWSGQGDLAASPDNLAFLLEQF